MDENLQRLAAEVDALQRELLGVQEMLGFVLFAVGNPVQVSKADMKNGLPSNASIRIDDDTSADAFIFRLETEDAGE